MKDYVEGFEKHSARIISCKIKLKDEYRQIIQVYAPTTSYDDNDTDILYDDLENAIYQKKCKQFIIMGDLNAKIGIKENNEDNEWIGPHGIGERNESGERLLDFVSANRMYITTHFFSKTPHTILDMAFTW
ncbi:endonuclease-reverse transcriptase [Elysia marginata]|uniref:Endonuclease-reverse transcriptase n=1 Tax=Elysia marginata TaxID=1093978 RepID=A0AAV4HC79_9GAST|nr:endonuclease-reverse transcriptase [Elysia marginata]